MFDEPGPADQYRAGVIERCLGRPVARTSGLRDALLAMKPASDTAQQEKSAPGVSGVLKLLNDEALWQGIRPLLAALETPLVTILLHQGH